MARRILHLADLHLGYAHSYLGSRAEERRSAFDGVLTRTVDWVLGPGRGGVGAVLIAGDLFDTHRPPGGLVERVIQDLGRLVRSGIPVVTVPGNHDELTYPDGIYRTRTDWPGVLVTNPAPEVVARFDLDGIPVEVVSMAYWQGRTPLPPGLGGGRSGSGIRVGVFHGTLRDRGFEFIARGERSLPLEMRALARAGFDYVAMGHVHERREFREGRTLAVYPGPPEGLGFTDPGADALTLVDVSDGQIRVELERPGVRSHSIASVDLDLGRLGDLAGLEAEIRRLCPPDPGTILRVVLRGHASSPLDTEALSERLGRAYFHIRLDPEFSVHDTGDWQKIAGHPTLEGFFARRMLLLLQGAGDDRERRKIEEAVGFGLRALGRGGG